MTRIIVEVDAELEKRLDRFEAQLTAINKKLNSLSKIEVIMSQSLDDLKAQVAQNTNLEMSAIILIRGLAQQIADAAGDPAALAQLSSDLKASADSLSAAVIENTPAAPA